jgi:hypothetical protein
MRILAAHVENEEIMVKVVRLKLGEEAAFKIHNSQGKAVAYVSLTEHQLRISTKFCGSDHTIQYCSTNMA